MVLQHSSGGFCEQTLEWPLGNDEAEAFRSRSGDAVANGIIGIAMKPSGDLIDFVLVEAREGRLVSLFSHKVRG